MDEEEDEEVATSGRPRRKRKQRQTTEEDDEEEDYPRRRPRRTTAAAMMPDHEETDRMTIRRSSRRAAHLHQPQIPALSTSALQLSNGIMKNMLLTFRVSELQMLLGYAGLNKTGRKTELQARAIELLKNKSVPHLTQVHAKIRELYKTIQQGGSVGAAQAVVDGGGGGGGGGGNVGVSQARVAPSLISPQPQQVPQPPASVPPSSQQQRALIQPQPAAPLHTFIPISSRSNMYGSMYGYQPKVTTLANQTPVYPIQPDVRFKRLPFFDVLGELLKPSSLVPSSTQRSQEGNFVFYLTPQQASDVAINRDVGPGSKNEYLIQVQLRFCLMETSCEQEDLFPPGVVVKVNNKVCPLPNPIPTNKPGVEPKRPPRPVNVSSLVKLSPSVANHINVTWTAEYGRGYVVAVNLVRKLTAADLLVRLKSKGIRHADFTTGLIKEKLCEDADTEIATTSLRVSLLCPLGKMRMVTPCRSTTCTHLQCFDASLFLQMNEKKPTWTCPVCDRPALYDNLVIDGYFQEVLCSNRLAPDSHEIQLHQDGSWSSHVAKKDQPSSSCSLLSVSPHSDRNRGQQLTPSKSEPIEEILDDSDEPPTPTKKNEDEEKKKNVIVVDLTGSDSEEEDEDDEDQDESYPSNYQKLNKKRRNLSRILQPNHSNLSDGSSNMSVDMSLGRNSPSIITLDSPSPPPVPLSPAPSLPPPPPAPAVAPTAVASPAPSLGGVATPETPPPPLSLSQAPAPPLVPQQQQQQQQLSPHQPIISPPPAHHSVYPTIVPTTIPNRPFVMQIRMPPDSRYQPY